MKVTTSQSKNAKSFYITLSELLKEHGPTRDDVMAWACEEAKKETLKYKEDQESKSVQITLHRYNPRFPHLLVHARYAPLEQAV